MSSSSVSFELFVVSFMEEDVYIGHTVLALKLSLRVYGTTTTGRLLDATTCLPHKDRSIPLSVLPKDLKSKLAGLFSILSLFC